MPTNGLLIDIQWCTGCHSCEVACQMLKELPPDQFGIKVSTIGPWEYNDHKWEFLCIPSITGLCDMCKNRVSLGMEPSCVKHCQANCIEYGTIEELAKKLENKPQAILLTAR